MSEADLLVVIGSRAVCQADCSGIGYKSARAVVNINGDLADAAHYNHTLALKPELYEAIEHRAEAYIALDRLEDAKASYMNLFNHARPLADQLLVTMQKWLESHRVAANGMRAADIDSFDKWLQEKDGIAKQTASAAAAAPAAAPATR